MSLFFNKHVTKKFFKLAKSGSDPTEMNLNKEATDTVNSVVDCTACQRSKLLWEGCVGVACGNGEGLYVFSLWMRGSVFVQFQYKPPGVSGQNFVGMNPDFKLRVQYAEHQATGNIPSHQQSLQTGFSVDKSSLWAMWWCFKQTGGKHKVKTTFVCSQWRQRASRRRRSHRWTPRC